MTTMQIDRAVVEQALEALEKTMNVWGGTCAWHGDVKHAITALRVALAQQAEPVEPGAWVASKDGRVIYDDTSKDDGLLRVSGDFENDEQRVRYAQRIVDKLNAAPPRRTMVPLTEEEILAAVGWERAAMYMKLAPNFPVDEAKKETLTNARAVEQALWEKHYGKA